MSYRLSVLAKPFLKMCLILFGLIFFSLLFKNAAYAQSGVDISGTGGKHEIKGRIYFPSGRRADIRLEVKLESSGGTLSVFTDSNGSFNFRSLAPGNYTVVVNGGEFYEDTQERVFIDTDIQLPIRLTTASRTYSVNINLVPKRDNNNTEVRKGVIDAALAPIPEKARELYLSAMNHVKSGDTKKAVELLNKAISAYPQFPLALTELGKAYLKLKQTDEAVKALQSAVKYAPESFEPHLNLGIALNNKNDISEAEKHLREAIKIKDSSWQAHMYMGLVYIKLRNYDGAENSLRYSLKVGGDKLSLPHYYLGGIYWSKGEFKKAADELETYLQLEPDAPDAERTRTSIKTLREKAGNN